MDMTSSFFFCLNLLITNTKDFTVQNSTSYRNIHNIITCIIVPITTGRLKDLSGVPNYTREVLQCFYKHSLIQIRVTKVLPFAHIWTTNFVSLFVLNIYLFVERQSQRERLERDGDRERAKFHLLVQSPKADNGWGWARQKPGATSSFQVSHRGTGVQELKFSPKLY